MRQKEDLHNKILEIKEEIGELVTKKGKLLDELRESCEHSGNVTYWLEAWDEATVVTYYQCLDCGLTELDQNVKRINTEGARRAQGKNRDLL